MLRSWEVTPAPGKCCLCPMQPGLCNTGWAQGPRGWCPGCCVDAGAWSCHSAVLTPLQCPAAAGAAQPGGLQARVAAGRGLCLLCCPSPGPSGCGAVASGQSLQLCAWAAESQLPFGAGRVGADTDAWNFWRSWDILAAVSRVSSLSSILPSFPPAPGLQAEAGGRPRAFRLRGNLP